MILSLGDGHRGQAFEDLFRAADGDLGYFSLVLMSGPARGCYTLVGYLPGPQRPSARPVDERLSAGSVRQSQPHFSVTRRTPR